MNVLRNIGSPNYIQVFISRDKTKLFIRGCDKKEMPCFAVPNRVYEDTEYKYVLRKVAFAEAISLTNQWDKRGSYRLYGVPLADRVIRFTFSKAERIDGSFRL